MEVAGTGLRERVGDSVQGEGEGVVYEVRARSVKIRSERSARMAGK